MPWWAFLYCILLLVVWLGSTVDDIRERVSQFWIAVDAITMIAWIFLIVAYFHPAVVGPLGPWVIIVLAVAVIGTGISVHHDLATLTVDTRLSERANQVIAFLSSPVTALIFVPAAAFGVLVVIRAF